MAKSKPLSAARRKKQATELTEWLALWNWFSEELNRRREHCSMPTPETIARSFPGIQGAENQAENRVLLLRTAFSRAKRQAKHEETLASLEMQLSSAERAIDDISAFDKRLRDAEELARQRHVAEFTATAEQQCARARQDVEWLEEKLHTFACRKYSSPLEQLKKARRDYARHHEYFHLKDAVLWASAYFKGRRPDDVEPSSSQAGPILAVRDAASREQATVRAIEQLLVELHKHKRTKKLKTQILDSMRSRESLEKTCMKKSPPRKGPQALAFALVAKMTGDSFDKVKKDYESSCSR